jgi:hypothetical protein
MASPYPFLNISKMNLNESSVLLEDLSSVDNILKKTHRKDQSCCACCGKTSCVFKLICLGNFLHLIVLTIYLAELQGLTEISSGLPSIELDVLPHETMKYFVYISVLVAWLLSFPVVFFLNLWTAKPSSVKKANCSIASVIIFYLALWVATAACALERIDILDGIALLLFLSELLYIGFLCKTGDKVRREARLRQ